MTTALRGPLLTSFLIVLASAAIADATAAEFSGELIFPAQDKHVHSSSIVELPGGDLLACWYHGSGERSANDVLIQGSRLRKGDRQWGPVFEMADTPNLPDCNPAMFVDARQRLWLFWVVPLANRWENSVLKYRRAESYRDNGSPTWSWQDSIHLVPGEKFAQSMEDGFRKLQPNEGMWAEYAPPYSRMLIEAAHEPMKRQAGWMTRTHPLTLPSGRILLPLYSDGFNASLMAISDDDGESWTASRPIVGLGPIQPSVVRRDNGTLVAYLRDSGNLPGRVMQSTSKDNGESWSLALDTDIPNSGSSLEALRLHDGRWVMVYNDTEHGRHRLAIACSGDEGRTWKWKRLIEDGTLGKQSYGYPSIIQSQDETLHVTYTHVEPDGDSIKHVALSIDWIVSGPSSTNE